MKTMETTLFRVLDPTCYGKNPGSRIRCRECEFFESCSYYARSRAKMESRLNMISFEHIQNWSEIAADHQHIPGCDPDECDADKFPERPVLETEIHDMAEFFRFILELDDYTLGILSQIIVPDADNIRHCSISELARIHNCTRQAMHRKILRAARHNPELGKLLQMTFRKISRSRGQFRKQPGSSSKSKPTGFGDKNCLASATQTHRKRL